jgi:hypothetical protein
MYECPTIAAAANSTVDIQVNCVSCTGTPQWESHLSIDRMPN